MLKKHKKTIFIIISIIFLINIFSNIVQADFNTGDYSSVATGDTNAIVNKFGGVITTVQTAGSIISIIALILIGIKYMVGSAEEKADYKESLKPYIIGATLVFAISSIVGLIQTLALDVTSSGTLEVAGGKVITILATIGSTISIIMIAVLGIKYMGGSASEKADYKKSLMPYFIGAICVFAASGIASLVYNLASQL